MFHPRLPRHACALLAPLLLIATAHAQCPLTWSDRFPSGELAHSFLDSIDVRASAVYDDGRGGGPEIYFAGDFDIAGGLPAPGLAKWNGTQWSVPGPANPSGATIRCFAIFDDGQGGGPQLYAGGSFSQIGGVAASNIARWNGLTWSPVGAGIASGVNALAVYDDGRGDGPRLYAGGRFQNHITRWNGSAWAALLPGPGGGGTDGDVNALAVYDSGSGPLLYAGGAFRFAGSASAQYIARFNGLFWLPVGGGAGSTVQSLAAVNSGPRAGLYIGGDFSSVGTIPGPVVPASRIARWNGSSWSALGNGLNDTPSVMTLHDFGDGAGPALYVGGRFTTAGGASIARLARWNGSAWSGLAEGIEQNSSDAVYAITPFTDSLGTRLFVSGRFRAAGNVSVVNLSTWDGAAWRRPGNAPCSHRAFPPRLTSVNASAVFDDGSGNGPALYIAGRFAGVGPTIAANIARWNGAEWSPLATGVGCTACGDYVNAIAATPSDFTGGPALYATGVYLHGVSRWNGAAWSDLGDGIYTNTSFGYGLALSFFDDPAGHALAVGGSFALAGGVPASNIARWNGSAWSPMGAGFDGLVRALAVFDDGLGSGPALYAAGDFLHSGPTTVNCIAKWDGAQWTPLEGGFADATSGTLGVSALYVHDDQRGQGPQLYAGGNFTTAGGRPAFRLARWNGLHWSQVGAGNPAAGGDSPYSFTAFDDGRSDGPVLYIGGTFILPGPPPSFPTLARFDGSDVTPLDTTPRFSVRSLSVFDDGSGPGPSLFAGGTFGSVAGIASARFAQLLRCPFCPADLDRSGTVNSSDFFLFLSAFFALAPAADFDHSGSVDSSDFFQYLNAFFTPCP